MVRQRKYNLFHEDTWSIFLHREDDQRHALNHQCINQLVASDQLVFIAEILVIIWINITQEIPA